MGQDMTKVTIDEVVRAFYYGTKVTTLDDPERPLRIVSKYMRFRRPPEKFE